MRATRWRSSIRGKCATSPGAPGKLAKTDRIDALVLARFAEQVRPRIVEKASEKQVELAALVTRRRQLQTSAVAETNRRETARTSDARKSIDKHLQWLRKEVARIDAAIAKLIASDETWRGQAEQLQVGAGRRDRPPAPCWWPNYPNWAGSIAARSRPWPDWRRTTTTAENCAANDPSGADALSVRSSLYMAALTARRCNPIIRAFAQRLEQAGKPFKVVLTACMRKLLTILNVLVKTNQSWSPKIRPINPLKINTAALCLRGKRIVSS